MLVSGSVFGLEEEDADGLCCLLWTSSGTLEDTVRVLGGIVALLCFDRDDGGRLDIVVRDKEWLEKEGDQQTRRSRVRVPSFLPRLPRWAKEKSHQESPLVLGKKNLLVCSFSAVRSSFSHIVCVFLGD